MNRRWISPFMFATLTSSAPCSHFHNAKALSYGCNVQHLVFCLFFLTHLKKVSIDLQETYAQKQTSFHTFVQLLSVPCRLLNRQLVVLVNRDLFTAHLWTTNNQKRFSLSVFLHSFVCLCVSPVNGFHSGGSPLHLVEHSHNSLVRKSSAELQVKLCDFCYTSFLATRWNLSGRRELLLQKSRAANWLCTREKCDGTAVLTHRFVNCFLYIACDFMTTRYESNPLTFSGY